MGRFYFDLSNGFGDIKDDDGLQLSSLHDVEREMSRVICDVMRDNIIDESHGRIGVSVRDESGAVVCCGNVVFSIQRPQERRTVAG